MDDLEYDPERKLWRPGRRSFLFMLGAAAVGAVLPGKELFVARGVISGLPTEDSFSMVEVYDRVTTEDFAHLLVETFSRDRVFAPFERSVAPFHRAMREEGAVFPFKVG